MVDTSMNDFRCMLWRPVECHHSDADVFGSDVGSEVDGTRDVLADIQLVLDCGILQ